jgi:hypothetical protein
MINKIVLGVETSSQNERLFQQINTKKTQVLLIFKQITLK